MQITIQVTGAQDTMSKLRRIKGGLTDFTNPMKAIGKESAEYFAGQGFASQGGVFGNVWKPLSEKYQAWKSEHYRGKPMLERTGDMRKGFFYESTSTQTIVGNKMPYYRVHQSTESRKKMPRRQMAGVNNDVKALVHKHITNDITRKLHNG